MTPITKADYDTLVGHCESLGEIAEFHSRGYLVEVMCIDGLYYVAAGTLEATRADSFGVCNVTHIGGSYELHGAVCASFDVLNDAMFYAIGLITADINAVEKASSW